MLLVCTHFRPMHPDRVTRTQAHEERLRKEAMLDDLLKAVFGYGRMVCASHLSC